MQSLFISESTAFFKPEEIDKEIINALEYIEITFEGEVFRIYGFNCVKENNEVVLALKVKDGNNYIRIVYYLKEDISEESKQNAIEVLEKLKGKDYKIININDYLKNYLNEKKSLDKK